MSLALGVARLASPAHLLLASEGRVHQHTFTPTKPAGRQWAKQPSENKTVAELGLVIFTALDYGLKEEEERQLSPALENMIDLMTSADEDDSGESGCGETDEEEEEVEDDEGIEDWEEDRPATHSVVKRSGTCDTLLALCR